MEAPLAPERPFLNDPSCQGVDNLQCFTDLIDDSLGVLAGGLWA